MPDDLPARLGTLLRIAADRPGLAGADELIRSVRFRRARRVRVRSLAAVFLAVVAVVGLVTGTLHRPAPPAAPIHLPPCPATSSVLRGLQGTGVPRPLPSDLLDDQLLPWTPTAGTICRYDVGYYVQPYHLLKQAPIPAWALETLPDVLNTLPTRGGEVCTADIGDVDALFLARPAGGWILVAYYRYGCLEVSDGLHSKRWDDTSLRQWADAILGRPPSGW